MSLNCCEAFECNNFLDEISCCEFCNRQYCNAHIYKKFHSCILPLPSSQMSVLSPELSVSSSYNPRKKKAYQVTKKIKHPTKKQAIPVAQKGRGQQFSSSEVNCKIYTFYFL